MPGLLAQFDSTFCPGSGSPQSGLSFAGLFTRVLRGYTSISSRGYVRRHLCCPSISPEGGEDTQGASGQAERRDSSVALSMQGSTVVLVLGSPFAAGAGQRAALGGGLGG